ncbi:hypothetical protein BJY01DRAFT_256481 [Aspergillus pseudoustus]|uniref:DUF7136 domain-containing protein n=1 Tax=Aspergillus pseudoustus TaxID=1810923 RepID=A0ABR4IBI9_9EURO
MMMKMIHFPLLSLFTLLSLLPERTTPLENISISIPPPPQTATSALLFPTNTTYKALPYFPLIFGLTNTPVSWPLHTILLILLTPLGKNTSDPTGRGEEIPPFPDASGGWEFPFTYGTPPPADSDSFVYHAFPLMLRNYSAGRYRLTWEFAFLYDCFADRDKVEDHWWDWGIGRAVEFTIVADDTSEIGEAAHDVDESIANWDCTDLEVGDREEDSEFAAAFEVLGWNTIDPRSGFENYTYCPILKNNMNAGKDATVPEPCRLSFGERDIQAIVDDARNISGCEGRTTLGEMEWDCYARDERARQKWKWGLGVVALILGVYSVLAMGKEWRGRNAEKEGAPLRHHD